MINIIFFCFNYIGFIRMSININIEFLFYICFESTLFWICNCFLLRVLEQSRLHKAGFPLGGIFHAQRSVYCFSSKSAKSVRWKVGSSSTFPPRKIPQTNHIAHFAYHVIKTIAAPYGVFRAQQSVYCFSSKSEIWSDFSAYAFGGFQWKTIDFPLRAEYSA
mgnify:CR=1 FL=1